MGQSKGYELSGGSEKKFSQTDIDNNVRRSMTDLGSAAGNQECMTSFTAAMAKSGPDPTVGQAMLCGGVRDWADSPSKAAPEAASDGEESDAAAPSNQKRGTADDDGKTVKSQKTAGGERKPPVETWFDQPRDTSQALLTQSQWIKRIRASFEEVADELREIPRDGSSPESRGTVLNEVCLSIARLLAVWRVLGRGAQDSSEAATQLRNYVFQVSQKMVTMAQVEEECGLPQAHRPTTWPEVSAASCDRLAQAPPCRRYAELRSLADMAEQIEGFSAASSKKELDDLVKRVMSLRPPISELLSVCRSVRKQARSAITVARKELEQAAAGSKAAKTLKKEAAPAGAASLGGGDFLQIGLAHGKSVHAVLEKDFEKLPPESPMLVGLVAKNAVLRQPVQELVEGFAAKWAHHEMRLSVGRVQRELRQKEKEVISAALLGMGQIPDTSGSFHLDRFPDKTASVFDPAFFAARGGLDSISREKLSLATVRVGFRGSRRVAMASVRDVWTFMEEVSSRRDAAAAAGGQTASTEEQARQFLSTASALELRAFVDKGGVWAATVTPGMLFYVPAGFIIAESVAEGSDHIGIRFPLGMPTDVDVLMAIASRGQPAEQALLSLATAMRDHRKETPENAEPKGAKGEQTGDKDEGVAAKEPAPEDVKDPAKEALEDVGQPGEHDPAAQAPASASQEQ